MRPYLDTEAAASLPRPALDLDRPALAVFLREHCPALFPASPAFASASAPGRPSPSPDPPSCDDIDVRQFGHGQSNPTYLVTDGRTGARVVLRKQPPGRLLHSAHAVDREFRLLSALSAAAAAAAGLPVPTPLAFSRDGAGLDGRRAGKNASSPTPGAQFYVMSFAPGRVYLDPRMPGEPARRRAGAYAAMAEALAALHSVDASAAGLVGGGGNGGGGGGGGGGGSRPFGGQEQHDQQQGQQEQQQAFGNPRGYCARQVERWARQYAESGGRDAGVGRLAGWLRLHAPRASAAAAGGLKQTPQQQHEEEQEPEGAIVHGDFRLDNIVFDGAWATSPAGSLPAASSPSSPPSFADAPAAPVAAVLDWELATLGDPWSDVAYMCLPYHLPRGALPSISLGDGAGLPEGVPTEAELLARYCSALERRRRMMRPRRQQGAGGGGGGGAASSPPPVRPPSPARWGFYVALSAFRLLAILEGVRTRARAGNASSAAASALASDAAIAALLAAAEAAVASASPAAPAPSPCPPSRVRSTLAQPSPRAAELLARVRAFVRDRVLPAEPALSAHALSDRRWTIHPLQEALKREAKAAGLWNLWIPGGMARDCVRPFLERLVREGAAGGGGGADGGGGVGVGVGGAPASSAPAAPISPVSPEEARLLLGPGLTNADYAHVCEAMGRSLWAPECFNCSAPDTGNMEVLARYGDRGQQRTWLLPLLRGDVRSCFAMTERPVASSDATNIQARIERVAGAGADGGDALRLTGVKWWTSGAMDPRCAVAIFMGRGPAPPAHEEAGGDGAGGGGGGGGGGKKYPHARQSMVLVPMRTTRGVTVVRPLTVYGYDDAPHGHAEVAFDGAMVDARSSVLLGAGRGFEIAQGRLGPGRLHHCMRLIGAGERALECWADRARARVAFGGPLSELGGLRADFARRRVDLDAARLLVLDAAAALDAVGHKAARGQIAAAKVAAPRAALAALDGSVQAHGGAGVSADFPMSALWAAARTLRIADGPDEVHLESLAKLELGPARGVRARL